MKHFYVGFTVSFIVALSGCTSSASYNLQRFTTTDNSKLELVDSRPNKDKEYYEGCKMMRPPVDNIGDKNVKPSKIELLRSAFAKRGVTSGQVDVKQFNLKLVYPNMCGVGRSSMMAAVSVPAAIITQSNNGYVQDGVVCELTITMAGKTVSGYSYVPARAGIITLFGASVSGEGLEEPLSQATNQCVENAMQSTN